MTKRSLTNRPVFWLLFILASIGGIIFSFKYFSKAIPLVNLDVTMDRESALKQAEKLAKKYQLGPKQFRQATLFQTDSTTQFFIELEAGGKKAFNRMLKEKLYEPYTWSVRNFQESEKNEVTVRFTPEGKPYGFKETLSENAPGPDLPINKAQNIAEQFTTPEWNIVLDDYKLIESSKEVRPSKRSDHTFVYELKNKTIGEGRYRLTLVVSGDKVTELTNSVKVPDDFERRYLEMRATNKTISMASGLLMFLLYIIGAGLFGVYFLLRSHFILWRMPLFWGGIIGLLHIASGINNLPIAWMMYDTALPARDFLIFYLVQIFVAAFAYCTIAALVFSAAESLTRKAFGNHPQLWKLWSKEAGSSTAVLGRTVGGYLIVSLQLALVIAIYLFANRFLNWWWPSDMLANPNSLASYFPWLSPVTNALSAGFIEECLFRAIPLACAVLLGNRFGKRSLWVAVVFVLQAFIFGGAHANYPAQPAYARLLELIIPSFIFGGMYLFYGLLPAILSHFIFDLVLMSLPLFVSTAPGMWVNKFLVIFAGLIPFFAILIARLRTGSFSILGLSGYNKAWQPTIRPKKAPVTLQPQKQHIINSQLLTKKILIPLSIISLIAWGLLTQFKQDAPRLGVSREEAVLLAQKELYTKGIELSQKWQILTMLFSNYQEDPKNNFQHRFIWQSDKGLYKKLIGTYLASPQWVIRFVTFNGNIAQRSEEYMVFITGDGKIARFAHRLPESQKGARLSEQAARNITHKHLTEQLNLQPKELKEVIARADKKPNRMDWTFVFSNPQVYPLTRGEARLTVVIGGDTVIDSLRNIHVPEDWERTERKRQIMMNFIKMICSLLLFLGFILALTKGGFSRFSPRVSLFSFGLLIAHSLFNAYNIWPIMKGKFNTIEPFGHQIFIFIATIGIVGLILSGLLAFLFGLVFTKKETVTRKLNVHLEAGIALGLLTTALVSFVKFMSPSLHPLWASFQQFGMSMPTAEIILDSTITYATTVTLTLILLKALHNFLKRNQLGIPALILLFLFIGLIVAGIQTPPTVLSWLLAGAAQGIFLLLAYLFVLRADHTVIVPAIATFIIGMLIQQAAFNAYHFAAIAYSAASIMIIMTCALLMTKTDDAST